MKFEYESLGDLATMVRRKAAVEKREHTDQKIILDEILKERGDNGWEPVMLNGDLIWKRIYETS